MQVQQLQGDHLFPEKSVTHIDFFVLAGLLQWLKPVHHHKLDSLYPIGEQGGLV